MLHEISLLTWDGNHYLIDSAPSVSAILGIDDLVFEVSLLKENECLDCRLLGLQIDCDDAMTSTEYLQTVAENIVPMLNNGELVITDVHKFKLGFVKNRGLGILQQYADIRQYYTKHPFI